MKEFLYILVIIFVIFGVSFLLINLRHIIKGEEFRGSCSSNNPLIKDQFGNCTICGKTGEEVCKMPEAKA